MLPTKTTNWDMGWLDENQDVEDLPFPTELTHCEPFDLHAYLTNNKTHRMVRCGILLRPVVTAQKPPTIKPARVPKEVIPRSALSGKAKSIYEDFRLRTDDSHMLAIQNYIADCPFSGRSLDLFLTTTLHRNGVIYHLKPTGRVFKLSNFPVYGDIRFNLTLSYRQNLHRYTKTYFDCFARGLIIEDTLEDGRVLKVPICQFLFYQWAMTYDLVVFLKRLKQDHGLPTTRYTTPGVQTLLAKYIQKYPRGLSLYTLPPILLRQAFFN